MHVELRTGDEGGDGDGSGEAGTGAREGEGEGQRPAVALPPVWRALREQAQRDKASGAYRPLAAAPASAPPTAPASAPAPAVSVSVAPAVALPVAASKDDDLGMD